MSHRLSGLSSFLDSQDSQHSLYVPIRTLGRGAFGEAVLYRRTNDNSLVVWKEIELTRCSAKDRDRTMNEIDVLAVLNHPNIVQYMANYQTDNYLLIEMEYANGGDLQRLIQTANDLLEQHHVEFLFFQLMSAVAYVHSLFIIHRDIKSLNIFLTKPAGIVKLGDFGISKSLNAEAEFARSVVGTPYYMSPELMQGKEYNQKSDIWACGCVLYEMLTLKKTFDATNALRLASNVVHGVFGGIDRAKYSSTMNEVLLTMLQNDPTLRPDAKDILCGSLFFGKSEEFELRVQRGTNTFTPSTKMHDSRRDSFMEPIVRSHTSEVFVWGGGRSVPAKIPAFQQQNAAVKVAAGPNCFAAISVEMELYTWSSGSGSKQCGQLGHGDVASYRQPKKVSAMEGKAVVGVSCGDEFTAILTGDGQVFCCGDADSMCLGDESLDEALVPELVKGLASPVTKISCGSAHVIVLSDNGSRVHTWGVGEFGRLGLGHEGDVLEPRQVDIGKRTVVDVTAGADCSILICDNGKVLVFGSNEFNKLGAFTPMPTSLANKHNVSYDIPCVLSPVQAKTLSGYHVWKASCGQNHSAFLDVFGKLLMLGDNSKGQLGTGDTRKRTGVHALGGPFVGRRVTFLSCGDFYTIASTSDNHVYGWGWAEDGRLGMTGDRGLKRQSGNCVCLPRPVFGSLHEVAGVASSHWSTILIAEKVESSKMLTRSSSASQPSSECTSDFEMTASTDIPSRVGSRQSSEPLDSSASQTCPDWLKQELEGAEFIPQDEVERAERVDQMKEEVRAEDSLPDEVLLLKQENQRLKDVVEEQQKLIEQLQARLDASECT